MSRQQTQFEFTLPVGYVDQEGNTHRDGVMRMLRAHVEGIHFLKTQKEASLKILAKYLRTNDRELLEGSYEIYNRDFIAAPYPIVSGLKLAYEQVAQRRPTRWPACGCGGRRRVLGRIEAEALLAQVELQAAAFAALVHLHEREAGLVGPARGHLHDGGPATAH